MKCIIHTTKEMGSFVIGKVKVDSCSQCEGLWFEADELRKAKDVELKDANWFDIDLWQDKSKFISTKDDKSCPSCHIFLYNLNYGDSKIKVDICGQCKGIWLDRGEFKKIIKYIRNKSDREVLWNYSANLVQETKEVFTGPESFLSEIADVIMLVDLFKYKFMTQHEDIARKLINSPII